MTGTIIEGFISEIVGSRLPSCHNLVKKVTRGLNGSFWRAIDTLGTVGSAPGEVRTSGDFVEILNQSSRETGLIVADRSSTSNSWMLDPLELSSSTKSMSPEVEEISLSPSERLISGEF